ncbi:hypothetical protein N9W68_00710 [Candidatus Pelagibacter bacterium]|nr:hypothetical protein [Candidatus Pelagibacter bacterium]
MPKKKITPIKYTSRDFESIKNDLIDYAKRYYPNRVNDFSKASFTSFVIDSVAYAGDILSYYLDYQTNESFLDTSIEFSNIRKHAASLGYNFSGIANSYGTVSLFVLIPANSDGTAPDSSYYPTLKRASEFRASNGANFILTEDVDFSDPKNEVVAARFDDSTGATTFFAVRAYGQVVSGKFQRTTIDLTNDQFVRFRRVAVGGPNISEIFSVVDTEGNTYYEVDYLSQETVYLETTNRSAASDGVRSILKPYVAPRRFVVQQDDTGTFLQFGYGSEEDDTTGLVEPSKVAIEMYGKRYITDRSFDPTQLLRTNKLGVSPSGTKLTVVYKINDITSTNVAVNSVNSVRTSTLAFTNRDLLSKNLISQVESSLEVNNSDPIVGDTSGISNEELKVRAKDYYASQNRAVTKQDYEALCYNMPKKFGTIKRVSVVNDPSATNRRMALYVVSEDNNAKLTTANDTIKNNLKIWLGRYKMLNDVIDILDAKILNFGIDFEISVTRDSNPNDVVNKVIAKLSSDWNDTFYVGEPIYVSSIYNIINKVDGVSDVKKVKVFNKSGGNYSASSINFDDLISRDGTFYKAPKNVIFELKFINADIRGVAK